MGTITFLVGFTMGVSGCTATINFALAALIFSSKHSNVARCERTYVLIFGSLIMDTILSLAYLFSSIVLIVTQERPSRLSCTIQTFSCVFFMLGTPLVGFSVILVAYDRLYAVMRPATYFKNSAKQAWIGVAVSFAVAFAILLVFIAIKTIRNSTCIFDFQGVSALMPILRCMRLATIVLAVTFYIAAYAYVRSNRDKLAKRLSQKHAMDRMMSLLKTSVITVLTAILFIFIPDICFLCGFFLKYTDWLNAMVMFKGATNIFIYTLRHRDVRKCVFSLDICKSVFKRKK